LEEKERINQVHLYLTAATATDAASVAVTAAADLLLEAMFSLQLVICYGYFKFMDRETAKLCSQKSGQTYKKVKRLKKKCPLLANLTFILIQKLISYIS